MTTTFIGVGVVLACVGGVTVGAAFVWNALIHRFNAVSDRVDYQFSPSEHGL